MRDRMCGLWRYLSASWRASLNQGLEVMQVLAALSGRTEAVGDESHHYSAVRSLFEAGVVAIRSAVTSVRLHCNGSHVVECIMSMGTSQTIESINE